MSECFLTKKGMEELVAARREFASSCIYYRKRPGGYVPACANPSPAHAEDRGYVAPPHCWMAEGKSCPDRTTCAGRARP